MLLQHSFDDDSEEQQKKLTDVYDVEEAIVGRGGYGFVQLARLKGAPSVVRAVKTVWKRNMKAQAFVRGEIKVLRRLDHPCICRLHETFEDHKAIYLVLEFIDGKELFDEIVECGCLDEAQAAVVMRQVFSALQYCHARRVVHRDLKPDNIMVQRHAQGSSSAPEVKLIDFGLAVMSSRLTRGRSGSSVVGSADYLAPEARLGTCCPASDVWSAGMVLHALLVGFLPTWDADSDKVVIDLRGPQYASVSPGAKDLLLGLLEADPHQRLDAAAAAAHTWSKGLEVGGCLMQPDMTPTLTSFVSFHRSAKLRRAALTALAMQLTSQQLQRSREQFLLVDTDGNGRISKEELARSIALSAPGGGEDVRDFVESIFDSLDTDGSQEIEYTEWVAAALNEGAYQSEEALRSAFRIFDLDGDGTIDCSEIGRVMKQTPEEIAGFLPDFDANGDGVLDFEEFKKVFEHLLPGTGLTVTLGTTKLSL